MFFLFLQTKVRSKIVLSHLDDFQLKLMERKLPKFLYILIETYYFALGENHKFGNTFLTEIYNGKY